MKIRDVHGEAVQQHLREQLGSHPEHMPCDRDDMHTGIHVDLGLLMKGGLRYIPCPECEAERVSDAKWMRMGVPAGLTKATFENWVASTSEQRHCKESVLEWIDNHGAGRGGPAFLVMAGLPGTGKSHLAAASVTRVGQGWMTTPAAYFAAKGRHMDNPKEHPDPLERAKRASVLVLDEFCVGGDRSDAPETWNTIFDHRYQLCVAKRMRPTIILSNAPAHQIRESIGLESVADRVRNSGVILTFNWESHRKNGNS